MNSILEYICTSNKMDALQGFYKTTLEALKTVRLTNTKLRKLYLEKNYI